MTRRPCGWAGYSTQQLLENFLFHKDSYMVHDSRYSEFFAALLVNEDLFEDEEEVLFFEDLLLGAKIWEGRVAGGKENNVRRRIAGVG
jgi:hypothetical protein